MKQKIEKINNLNDKIETNKKFLELLKIGGTYLRDKDNNVTNLEKENRFLEIGIGVTVHSQEGGCNSKFEWTKDTF